MGPDLVGGAHPRRFLFDLALDLVEPGSPMTMVALTLPSFRVVDAGKGELVGIEILLRLEDTGTSSLNQPP